MQLELQILSLQKQLFLLQMVFHSFQDTPLWLWSTVGDNVSLKLQKDHSLLFTTEEQKCGLSQMHYVAQNAFMSCTYNQVLYT